MIAEGQRQSLHDAAGKAGAFLNVGAHGPGMPLIDAAGKTIWRAP